MTCIFPFTMDRSYLNIDIQKVYQWHLIYAKLLMWPITLPFSTKRWYLQSEEFVLNLVFWNDNSMFLNWIHISYAKVLAILGNYVLVQAELIMHNILHFMNLDHGILLCHEYIILRCVAERNLLMVCFLENIRFPFSRYVMFNTAFPYAYKCLHLE